MHCISNELVNRRMHAKLRSIIGQNNEKITFRKIIDNTFFMQGAFATYNIVIFSIPFCWAGTCVNYIELRKMLHLDI